MVTKVVTAVRDQDWPMCANNASAVAASSFQPQNNLKATSAERNDIQDRDFDSAPSLQN